ncbi:MAG: aminotransferase class V-fold PLP-dependent enzyme, partial [Candidatus Melainabacteria bacterium]|nr:aminotransferase class V-fold PLP-dependent enzyme [Candidatus Melainabacteria bacterium]
MSIYFDNAATTAMTPEILSLIDELNLSLFGNPSSLHSHGRAARQALNQARQTIASVLNANSEEIIFTSGATEANSFVFAKLNYDLIITSPAEHSSVIEAAKASSKAISWLDLDEQGYINLEQLEELLEENYEQRILLSIMHANNEIGTLQDLEAISELKQKYHNVIWHSDCVQSFAKYPIDVKELSLDLLSASAHKIHGPKGCGLLYIKKQFQPEQGLIIGGGQEFGLRSGTENIVSIIAMAEASKILSKKVDSLKTLHNYI